MTTAETLRQERELRKIAKRYRDAQEKAEALRQERNLKVKDAVEAGVTQTEVSRITGLNRQRIGQIVRS